MDPEFFFTYENLINTGKTIEDFEEQAGYPKGWTDCGMNIKERIDLIRNHQPKPQIDYLFQKYLDVDRFGNKIDDELI